jgi:hypothetical protein
MKLAQIVLATVMLVGVASSALARIAPEIDEHHSRLTDQADPGCIIVVPPSPKT